MKFKVVSGYVVAFSVLGFTAYAIYKHVKNKENEDIAISFEEARAEVEKRRVIRDSYRIGMVEVQNRKMDEDEVDDTIEFTAPISIVPQEEDEDEGELFDEEIPDYTAEEGKKLKHDPNSQEARQQFINMELSDCRVGDDSYQMLLKLFNFPFNPVNDGDQDLKTKLIDYRVRFFGFGSKWVQDISFAEVILYYARAANYNYDETIKYWVDYFLQFNSMDVNMSSVELDDVIERLNSHTYHHAISDTYGLFGLTSVAMDNAIQISMRNVDNSVTYEIEFNEFLKSLS